jgi:hypothetical protein
MKSTHSPDNEYQRPQPTLDAIWTALQQYPGLCEHGLEDVTGLELQYLRAGLAHLRQQGRVWVKKTAEGETYYFPEWSQTEPSAIQIHLRVVLQLLCLVGSSLEYAVACLGLALERTPDAVEHGAVGWHEIDEFLSRAARALTPVSRDLDDWLPRLEKLRSLVHEPLTQINKLNRLIPPTEAGA